MKLLGLDYVSGGIDPGDSTILRISIQDRSGFLRVDLENCEAELFDCADGIEIPEVIRRMIDEKASGDLDLPDPPSIRERFKSFVRAQVSVRKKGRVALSVLDYRFCCCHGETLKGIQVRGAPCRARKVTEGGKRFCKPCGCPEWEMADLDIDLDKIGDDDEVDNRGIMDSYGKLECPEVACPLGYFGPSPGIKELENG